MIILWVLLGAVLAGFLLVVLRGAPYVPTHRAQIRQAISMLDIPAGGTVVDLGSGDGSFLKDAAAKGYRAIGYELNPFLCFVAYLRCWRYRDRVKIYWRDFWLTRLPEGTDAVFVFLAGPYLKRLDRKLETEKTKPLTVISYGFAIPGRDKPDRTQQALLVYHY